MTVSSGPDRSSRGPLGIWGSSKAAEGNNEQRSAGASTTTNGSGSDVVVMQGRNRLSARFQRSSSKLLTLLRPHRDPSNVAKESSPVSRPTSNLDQVGSGSRFSYPVGAKDALVGQNSVSRPQSAPVISLPHSPTSLGLESPPHLSTALHSEGRKEDGQETQKAPIDDSGNMQGQQTQLNQNLSALLSSKLSTAFVNSTIVHRSNLHTRPSIWAFQHPEGADDPLSKQGDNTVESSDPSTSPSSAGCWSSNPSNPKSTPPTSGESVSPIDNSKSLFWTKADNEKLECNRPQKKCTSVQAPNTPPSIVTVEAAANAKVFFETYFNAVFSHVNARSQRRIELEKYLYSLRLTPEEQETARKAWIEQEREYLRQYRVLKTRCHNASPGKAASVANYEIVKVLGNGSFGIVSLVREKKDEGSKSSEGDSPALENGRMSEVKTRDIRARKLDGGTDHRRQTTSVKGIYAMKVIRKAEMLRSSQEGHLRAERDFLVASAKSRWVVPLIASFQDSQNLYLVMEYMIGGDFLGLLIRENVLPEPIAKWYIAEMVLCVEESHKLNWIHRDIKPDNFLISASGHLKIADFGLAFDGHWAHDQGYYNNHRYSLIKKLGIQIEGDVTDREDKEKAKQALETMLDSREPPSFDLLGWRDRHQRRRLARSVVGTSQYMAPEVVKGKLYDGRCDWWSIGIILYECLYGFTPFVSDDRFTTKLKIVNHHQILHFPMQRLSDKFVSTDAIDLISQLLQEKEYRLSARNYRLNDLAERSFFKGMDPRYRNYRGMYVCPNDSSDIKMHPFFRGINWDALHRSTPPFIPVVRDWDDTQYFEDPFQSPPDSNTPNAPGTALEAPSQTADATPGDMALAATQANKVPCGAKTQKKRAKEGRARDKILRDEQVGKTVLEMRQKDAFLGYTYRRPKPVALALKGERGRPLVSRGRLSDLYGC